jgi:hypothetical protein
MLNHDLLGIPAKKRRLPSAKGRPQLTECRYRVAEVDNIVLGGCRADDKKRKNSGREGVRKASHGTTPDAWLLFIGHAEIRIQAAQTFVQQVAWRTTMFPRGDLVQNTFVAMKQDTALAIPNTRATAPDFKRPFLNDDIARNDRGPAGPHVQFGAILGNHVPPDPSGSHNALFTVIVNGIAPHARRSRYSEITDGRRRCAVIRVDHNVTVNIGGGPPTSTARGCSTNDHRCVSAAFGGGADIAIDPDIRRYATGVLTKGRPVFPKKEDR